MDAYRFTDQTRAALDYARAEAQHRGQDRIDADHLLLGLLTDASNLASAMFTEHHIAIASVRALVASRARHGDRTGGNELPYTQRARHVLELAMAESRDHNDRHVSTGHLIVGILRDSTSTTAATLTELGADLDGMRHSLFSLMRRRHAETAGAPRSSAMRSLSPLMAAQWLRLMAAAPQVAPILAKHGVDVPGLLGDLEERAAT